MKKSVSLVLVAVILLSFLVYAETSPVDTARESVANISQDVKNKSNNILQQEIKIPEELQIPAKVIFGLDMNEELDLQHFIVLFGVWFVIYLVLVNSWMLIPYFDKRKQFAWVLGFIVTCVLAFLGVINYIVGWMFSFSKMLLYMEGWGTIRLVVIAVVIIIVFVIFTYSLRALREMIKTGRYAAEGAWVGAKIAKANREAKEAKKKTVDESIVEEGDEWSPALESNYDDTETESSDDSYDI